MMRRICIVDVSWWYGWGDGMLFIFYRKQYQLQRLVQGMIIKRSHRRTQSANIVYDSTHEPPTPPDNTYYSLQQNLIIQLLHQCQANSKAKVCSVQSLNEGERDENSKMFNFGRGFLKESVQKREKQRNLQQLISIPEKAKANITKSRKYSEIEVLPRNKSKNTPKPVLKNSNKELNKHPYHETVTKLIKTKIGNIEQNHAKKGLFLSLNIKKHKEFIKQSKHEKKKSSIK